MVISTEATLNVSCVVDFNIRPEIPQISADTVSGTAVIDTTTYFEFTLVNSGSVSTGNMTVELPASQSYNMTLAATSSNISALLPTNATTIGFLLSAPSASLGSRISGAIVVRGALFTYQVHLNISIVSRLNGTVTVFCEDEFTYFSSGSPRVAGAVVSLRSISGFARAMLSDASGICEFTNVPEDYYEIVADADRHATFRAVVRTSASGTTVNGFLQRQMVGPHVIDKLGFFFLLLACTNVSMVSTKYIAFCSFNLAPFLSSFKVSYVWSVTEIAVEQKYAFSVEVGQRDKSRPILWK